MLPLPNSLHSNLSCPGRRYEGKGLFLEPPSVGMSKGMWRVKLPAALDGIAGPLDLQFPTRDAVFSASRCLICFCSWLFSSPVETPSSTSENLSSTM